MENIIKLNRKYIHKRTGWEVYCVGRVEYLPKKIPLVVYITLIDGKSKAADEITFLNSYSEAVYNNT